MDLALDGSSGHRRWIMNQRKQARQRMRNSLDLIDDDEELL
jgi:hypothetical protein